MKDDQSDGEVPSDKETKSEGVKVPEQFQKSAHSLLKSASREMCDYMRTCVNQREDALREEKNAREKKNKPDGKPNAVVKFTSDEAPSY